MEEKVSGQSWFAAIALFLAYMLSYADRTIMSLVVEPVKADLQLTDFQISLLLGISFVILYTVMGVPIAVLADRGNRKRIILAGMALWTVATAACGMARSYVPLFLARTAVGIGESCLNPASHSLLGDIFPRRLLPRALSIFGCGVYVGSGAALMIGGVVTAMAIEAGPIHIPLLGVFKAWQIAFIFMGVVGVPFLLLIAFIKEPPRRELVRDEVSLAALGQHASLTRAFLTVYCIGQLGVSIGGLAIQSWAPTIMIRVHGWSIRDAGVAIGLVYAIGGIIGAIGAAYLVEFLQRRGVRDAIIRVMALAAGIEAVSSLLIMSGNGWAALTGIALTMGLSAVQAGVGMSSLMLTTPPRLRAKMSSMFSMFVGFIGIGVGPILVALVTENVYDSPMALGKAVGLLGFLCLTVASIVYVIGRGVFLKALLRQEEAMPVTQAEPAAAA